MTSCSKEVTRFKVKLMCLGVRGGLGVTSLGRVGGAGPAGGRYVLLPGTVTPATNVPFQGKFVLSSPYHVEKLRDDEIIGEYMLYEDGKPLMSVGIVEKPRFLEEKTSDGIPFWKLAALHGTEVIGITVNKNCVYWDEGMECKFCAIQQNIKVHEGKSLALKNPEHLVEVILAAEKHGFCKHITLTAGTAKTEDRGLSQFIPYIRRIREVTSTPIHVQIEPPKNPSDITKLYDVGADTVGIHIESLDEKIRETVCPGKAQVGIENYYKAWKEAVKVFGENQVNTVILAGLGEDKKITIRKLEEVCLIGVIPLIFPFRPLPRTKMETHPPPNPNYMFEILSAAALNVRRYGLRLESNRAGCVRCGACSPLMETVKYGV